MPFVSYPKIHRLGHEDNDGILIGLCHIQEKVDGANTSIWCENGEIRCGSRTQDITGGNFNGFVDYIKAHTGIQKLFAEHPHLRLYGEWLVRHSISYDETSYRKFYLFDIFTDADGFLEQSVVAQYAVAYFLDTPQMFGMLENPTLEQIEAFAGKSNLGPVGEGVVIKNQEFTNKFGGKVYAKVVTQGFKEENALVFGGNNKHSECYWEQFVVNKYVTVPRVQKIMNKLQPTVNKRLDMEDTARVINTVYHDMITEEIWDIQKKVPMLNFKKLQQLSTRKAAKVYHDILNNTLSVAYGTQDTESPS